MWLTFFLTISLPAQINQDNQGAETLFQKMEAVLDKAKTLDLSFETLYGEGSLRSGQRLKGTLVATSGDKLRLEVKGGKANETVHLRVADGTRGILIVEGDNGGTNKLKITPKRLTANMLTAVARSGVLLVLLPKTIQGDENDYRSLFRVSEFKLGNKEKGGERETQRIDYVLGVKGQKTTYPVTLWIELKTGLPVKRIVSDGRFSWFSETYELTIDAKFDPKMFELPK